ncbi:two component transcriptional regulator, LuxR family [Cnuella takakiae]|uniref:Two component transcriptional regulator, LuxR family n=1 Tax=Cnuella takakiae TaxID=1302690 RepID=A0A1M5GBR6_9BACT|nr:response regulator transcription factor [Cnuella takakiae]OLY92364.1 hypothetical protein BUE76_11025 [Cnuella takakiae]SHG01240.1 two component transcriptional regulator, LuxR family [Cnuella takakiae]
MKPIKIVIADDHKFLRSAWKIILENDQLFEVTGLAGTGEEAVTLVLQTMPDIILMDMLMPVMDGFKATRIIHSLAPNVRILGVSAEVNPVQVRQFLDSGAHGYVSKYARATELKEALLATIEGKRWICPHVTERFMNELPYEDNHPRVRPLLTRKEAAIAQMMQQGADRRTITRLLDLSDHSLEVHRTNIIRKLGIRKDSMLATVLPQLN